MELSFFWILSFLTISTAVKAVQLPNSWPGCYGQKETILKEELRIALDMASIGELNTTSPDYYDVFFDQKSQTTRRFDYAVSRVFADMGTFIRIGTNKISCDNGRDECQKAGYLAHYNIEEEKINFCDKFFELPSVQSTRELLDKRCDDLTLSEAHSSRAAIIVHLATHIEDVMQTMNQFSKSSRVASDYASGVGDTVELAKGEFNRGCAPYRGRPTVKNEDGKIEQLKPLCPDKDDEDNEGVCDESLSRWNADSYALLAAGLYFTEKCQRAIPLYEETDSSQKHNLSSTPSKRDNKGNGFFCKINKFFAVDPGNDERGRLLEPEHLDGYVHFGDSYASGMGTGDTSADVCRVGSNNYGRLLSVWMGNRISSFERLSCSGDTSEGVHKQIEKWANYKEASIGTMTLGGNDLGFADMVTGCVLNLNPTIDKEGADATCEMAKAKARDLIDDQSDDGLTSKLRDVLLAIFEKAEKQEFKLYVAGYVPFFREDTKECDNAYFNWWGEHVSEEVRLYLKQEKRVELNALVYMANLAMTNAILEANGRLGKDRIFFVDLWNRWKVGRNSWCEDGVQEPDEDRPETWLFLSGWKDMDDPDEYDQIDDDSDDMDDLSLAAALDNNVISQDEADKESMMILSEMNAKTCEEEQAKQLNETGSLDPFAKAACDLAQFLVANSDSEVAHEMDEYYERIRSGNVTTRDLEKKEVDWYVPSRQAKTFHPRSNGMRLYRDAIIEAIERNGGI